MRKDKKEYKIRIIKVLSDFGRLPTARVSAIVGMGYGYIVPLLKEMEEEGSVKSEHLGELATYWTLPTQKSEEDANGSLG